MRVRSGHRLVRLLTFTVLALVVVFAFVFLARNKPVGPVSKPSPLSMEEYRLLSPETHSYIFNQPDACKKRSPFLLLIVPVAPLEFSARDAVRETWGAPSQDTMTLFYLGVPKGVRLRRTDYMLEQESKKYSDIIQMNFLDTYKNLTIKSMMIMNWLASHCPNATYAMKVDADIFLNVFYLVRLLRSSPRNNYITGSVIADGKPRRDRNSKWYLSKQMFPEDNFPVFVSGAGYVFSIDMAAKVSWASRFVPSIPLEDAYVGLCLRMLGVRPAYSRNWLAFRNLFEIRNLDYDRCTFTRLVLVHGFPPTRLKKVWKDFSQGSQSCWIPIL